MIPLLLKQVLLVSISCFTLTKAACDLGFTRPFRRTDELKDGILCGDIQLPNSNLRRNAGAVVCTMSRANNTDSCEKKLTFKEANQYCKTYGMRLPTFTEANGFKATRNLDCGSFGTNYLNVRKIWTQSNCNSGRWVTSTTLKSNYECVDTSDLSRKYWVACVADTLLDGVVTGPERCIPCPKYSIATRKRNKLENCECQFPFEDREWDKDMFQCKSSVNALNLTICGENEYALITSKEKCQDGWTYSHSRKWCYKSNLHGNTCPSQNDLELSDYETAQTYCLSAGARLCTSQELKVAVNDERCSSLSNRWLWSQTLCGKDKYLLRKRGDREICRSKNDRRFRKGFQCCRDVKASTITCKNCGLEQISKAGSTSSAECKCKFGRKNGKCIELPAVPPTRSPIQCGINKYEGGSSLTCKSLGWSDLRSVEDSSRNYDGNNYRFCFNEYSDFGAAAEASLKCIKEGARLCTKTELREIITSLNPNRRFWSSSPCCTREGTCSEKKYLAVARSDNECKLSSLSATAVCCADVGRINKRHNRCFDCPSNSGHEMNHSKSIEDCTCVAGYFGAKGGSCKTPTPMPTPHPTVTQKSCGMNEYLYGSSRTCKQLELEFGEDSQSCSSDIFDGTCPPKMNFAEAKQFCEMHKMRLCRNKYEIRQNSNGFRCHDKGDKIWIDRSCNDEGSSYFIANRIRLGRGENSNDECLDKGKEAFVACCADYRADGICANCPVNSISKAGSKGIDSCVCIQGYERNKISSIAHTYCRSRCYSITGPKSCKESNLGCKWFGEDIFSNPDHRCCGTRSDYPTVCGYHPE